MAKMITSGMVGLNTSGLALYFGPQLFEEVSESPIYENIESDYPMYWDEKWDKFSDQEKAIYDKLKDEVSKFSEALQKLGQEKSKENSKILSHFKKVEETEQELKKLYEDNKSILEKMSEIGKQEHQAAGQQLDADEKLKKLNFYLESLKSASSAMHGWGTSVKEFICAIENKESVNCQNQGSKWFSLSSSSTDSSSTSSQVATTGGGDNNTQGKEALKQLQESKEKLEKELKTLNDQFKSNLWNFWSTSFEKEVVDSIKKKIDEVVNKLKKSWGDQKSKLDSSVQKTQEKTTTLNKSYEELRDSYNKWEKIKQIESGIHSYKGLMDSLLQENLFVKRSSPKNK